MAGDEQFDGGASAVQRVHDGLRVAVVEYCTDESAMECSNSCKTENVYYQQSCEVMV